jgi:hypothetical protein
MSLRNANRSEVHRRPIAGASLFSRAHALKQQGVSTEDAGKQLNVEVK